MKIGCFAPGGYTVFFCELIRYSKSCEEGLDWHLITNSGAFLTQAHELLDPSRVCYIFSHFNSIITDGELEDFSEYPHSIYRDIFSDKYIYQTKPSSYQMKVASTLYRVLKGFLVNSGIKAIVFPDVEYVEGMILLGLCKELEIKVLYYVHCRVLHQSFFAMNEQEEWHESSNNYSSEYVDHAHRILKEWRLTGELKSRESKIQFSQVEYDHVINKYRRTVVQRLKHVLIGCFGREKHYLKEDASILIRIRIKFLTMLDLYRRLKRRGYNRCVTLRCESELNFRYVYFPLQVTPESSINTLEPFFVDQFRAIELLLMHFPSDVRVVVKEHPAFWGTRCTSFYKRLGRMPGVEIASMTLSSDLLRSKSELVASVTGTALLEAMLYGSKCFSFGRTFFSEKDSTFDSFRQLEQQLKDKLSTPANDSHILSVVSKVLYTGSDFYIELPRQYFYQPRPVALMPSNINNTLTAIKDALGRLVISEGQSDLKCPSEARG
jgi:hypothetical protein